MLVPTPIPVPEAVPRTAKEFVGPLIMVVAIGGVFYVLYASGLMRYTFFPVVMLVTYGAMFFRRGGTSHKQPWREAEKARRDWSNRADAVREELAVSAERQFTRAWWSHPRPRELAGLVGSDRMWERSRSSSGPGGSDGFGDFGHVRFGVGAVESALKVDYLPLPDDVVWIEPASGHGLRKFLQVQSHVQGMPRVVSLLAVPAMSLVGVLDEVRGVARAMICQLCLWHSPDDLKVMVVTSSPGLWEWVKWLPHAQDPGQRDGCGERRMVFGSAAEFESYHGDELSRRGAWSSPAGPQAAVAGVRQPGPLWVVIDDACGPAAEWASAAPPRGVGGVSFVRLAEEPGFVPVLDETASRQLAPALGFSDGVMYRVADGVARRADVKARSLR